MDKELETWRFVADQLVRDARIMLLVVAESSGSSPGRAGYKMAVAADGDLCGSIGGGVMEVALVERCRVLLAETADFRGETVEQVHRKHSPNSSGMICSGSQTVIFKLLNLKDLGEIRKVLASLEKTERKYLRITRDSLELVETQNADWGNFRFENNGDNAFEYLERLGPKNNLYIVGGGHCALALSEISAKLDFEVSIFDDRPGLNTVEKNRFADAKEIVNDYAEIGSRIPGGQNVFVVVMTLGYKSDEIVIRSLFDKDFRYFGVLGSKAKMGTLLKSLRVEGFDETRLKKIRTPIGLPINSHTPEEIAVSIAAELIAVKNA